MEAFSWLLIGVAGAAALGVLYMTGILQKFLRYIYGDFTPAERKKFILYGGLFFFIIGIYWSLRCLKDSVFNAFVGSEHTWMAKILSLIIVFPVVIGYSYLVDIFPRHRLFYAMAGIYAAIFVGLSFLLGSSTMGICAPGDMQCKWLGWASYILIETYGSLMPALFYSFMADTTTPEAGKKGFFVTASFAQLGAILGSGLVATQSMTLGVPTLVAISGITMLLIIPAVFYINRSIPKAELAGYQAKGGTAQKKSAAGFTEGLKLMFSKPYLFGIFVVVAGFELVTTLLDLQFKIFISQATTTAGEFAAVSGEFGVWVSFVALVSLLLGIGNIGRKIGLKLSLALVPLVMIAMTAVMFISPILSVAFWVMVIAKGINYALGQPSKEQLFIPTTKDAKYKSKAWIDMFGSRGSKATASALKGASNAFGKMFGAAASSVFLSGTAIVLCIGWFFTTLYLGKKHKQAVDNNEVVC